MLPFILAGVSLLSAGAGIGAMIDAKETQKRAESIIQESKRKFDRRKAQLEKANEELNSTLQCYGELKVALFQSVIKEFLDFLDRYGVDAKSKAQIRKYIKKGEIIKLRNELASIEELPVALSMLDGGLKGAMVAYAVYGGVTSFAAASTGTAISALSGAAARNAALAWLGGGSLATGGLGVLGGQLVLGGITIGPALLVTGLKMSSEAEKNLTEAYKFQKEVNEKVALMDRTEQEYEEIQRYVKESSEVLEQLRRRFYSQFRKLRRRKHNPLETITFQQCVLIVKQLKKILEAPLVNDGKVAEEFIETIEAIKLSGGVK